VPPVQHAGPRVAAWLAAHPELTAELSRRTGAPISFSS
jgi:ribonuclease G